MSVTGECIKMEGYYSLRGGDFTEAGAAATELRSALIKIAGIDSGTVRRAAVAAFEAEMNVIIHAVAGTLSYEVRDDVLTIRVTDMGPGIPDIGLAMQEGYTTAPEWAKQKGWGNGQGLPNMKRNADRLDVDSIVGEGTTVVIMVKLRADGGQGPGGTK